MKNNGNVIKFLKLSHEFQKRFLSKESLLNKSQKDKQELLINCQKSLEQMKRLSNKITNAESDFIVELLNRRKKELIEIINLF